jgi:CheY-like chemotaxis protein
MGSELVSPLVIIGYDIMALGLAAALRTRGLRVVVRGGMVDGRYLPVETRPAAIIVDLLMAKRDGYALLRALRSEPGAADVPILVLSSGTVLDESEVLEAHVRAFDARPLLTPHDVDSVFRELERSLARVA